MKIIRHILVIIVFSLSAISASSVTYKEGHHIPLIFIINQTGSENPSSDSIANTYMFNLALKAKNAAILVSRFNPL